MDILISDLVSKIKETYNSTKVLSVDYVYEKIDDSIDLKLVIDMNHVFYDDINVIYTKLIFTVDKDKYKLTKNYFSYLKDINCIFNRVNFDDIHDMMNKLSDLFKSKDKKFGEDIKILSEFIKSPSVLINEWLKDNDVSDISVTGVKFEPKMKIVSCKLLFFPFLINLNNGQTIDLEIRKERVDLYNFSFKIYDKYETLEKQNLYQIVQDVGGIIKNEIKL